MYEKPFPSPIRFSAGTSTRRKDLVGLLIIVSTGTTRSASASRMSTRNTESPAVRFSTLSMGARQQHHQVECWTREMKIFLPVTT
jgi:hypothetical protein